MLAVRQLNMVGGGPRGRSGAGISIEGADGSKAVLTAASARSPIQAAPSQGIDEYAQEGGFSRRAVCTVCTTVAFYLSSIFASLRFARFVSAVGRRTLRPFLGQGDGTDMRADLCQQGMGFDGKKNGVQCTAAACCASWSRVCVRRVETCTRFLIRERRRRPRWQTPRQRGLRQQHSLAVFITKIGVRGFDGLMRTASTFFVVTAVSCS